MHDRMEKRNDKERHGKEDVRIPSSQPREERNITGEERPVSEERRQKPDQNNTPETGPGGE